jgi:predicted metal-dependent hydrolase
MRPIAKSVFYAEVRCIAKRMKVAPSGIEIADLGSKWGTCSASGSVTFDFGVLALSMERRHEIIVHELTHLRLRRHGHLFRAFVSAQLASLRSAEERRPES